MKSISPDLLEKIRHARSLEAIPHDHSIVPCATIGELLQMRVEEHEGEPFLIFYEDEGHRQELSYREFYEEVCRTANYFSASGIRQGSRIGVVSTNHTDTVVAYFAGFLLGGVIVPISTEEEDRRISHILSHSGVEMLLVRAQFVDRILRLLPPSQVKIACTGQRIRADLPYAPAEIARQPSTLTAPSGGSRDDEALLVFTSGTGGPPRGVVLTHYNLLVDAMAIAEWHVLSPDQRMMCVLPLHHVNGIVVTLLTPLFAGCGVVLNQKFHANRFFERISAERVSLASVVPTLLQFLLHSSLDMEAYKLASFRHLVCGAGPLTVELAQKFEQTFKIPIIHGYGLSEATCYASFLPLDLNHAMHKQWLTKHGFPSIGVPLPVNEMEIHDPDGKPQEEGARGEIVIRGHNVMKEYLDDAEANASTFRDGWLRTGDEGFYLTDDEGRQFFFITGRIKELIIRGGANISPFEIDEVLKQIAGVEIGIAVGFENDWYGEEVGAYVVLKEGTELSEEQILKLCQKRIPFAMAPKVVIIGKEIPVTSTGRYERSHLKGLFAPHKETQFSEKR